MTAASMKPVNAMARLHLGCGESLSQLLPAEQEQPKSNEPQLRDLPRKKPSKPGRGGGH